MDIMTLANKKHNTDLSRHLNLFKNLLGWPEVGLDMDKMTALENVIQL
jgi:hypothetical protein